MSRWLWQLRWGVGGIAVFALWFVGIISNPFRLDPVVWAAILSIGPALVLFIVVVGIGNLAHRRYRRKLLHQEFTDQSGPEPSSHVRPPHVAKPR